VISITEDDIYMDTNLVSFDSYLEALDGALTAFSNSETQPETGKQLNLIPFSQLESEP